MTDRIITIDGPSGVGKGTLARFLAKKLNWHLLDSGAIYRALACYSKLKGISSDDINQLSEAALNLPISFGYNELGQEKILLDGQEITKLIRDESVGLLASKISKYPNVRDGLMSLQRSFYRNEHGLIADGRDMGTVIFPYAKIKLFLDASSEIRANRRHTQLSNQGVNIDKNELTEKVIRRDRQDRSRNVAPLTPAKDAIIIDTSQLSIQQVQDKVIEILKKNGISC